MLSIKKLDDMGTIPSKTMVQILHEEKDKLNTPLFISKINLLQQESPNPCRLNDKSYQRFKAEIMPITNIIIQGKEQSGHILMLFVHCPNNKPKLRLYEKTVC